MEPTRSQNLDGFRHTPRPDTEQRPTRPAGPMSDFAARPTSAQPRTQSSQPTPNQDFAKASVAPTHTPTFRAPSHSKPVTGYIATPLPKPQHIAPKKSVPTPPVLEQVSTELEKPAKTKEPKPHNENGHAGLVGFGLLALLTALFLLPFLPGKTLDNFPGSSQSFSSGDESFACIEQPSDIKSTTVYSGKAGFPITYKYTSTTHQQATCEGKSQTIAAGRSSQFNPLGLAANVAIALVIALGVGKLWSVVYHATHKQQRLA